MGESGGNRLSAEFAVEALNALSAHIAVLDAEGTILAVNDAWVAFGVLNGLPPHEGHVGVNYLSICSSATGAGADDALAIAAGLRDVMAGRVERFEMEYPCHSPVAERWFIARVTRSRRPMSQFFVVAHEDITERRKVQVELGESEAMLRKAQEVARIGSFIYDPAGCRWAISPTTARIFGMRPSDQPTRDAWVGAIHPDDREAVTTAASRAAASCTTFEGEYRILRANDGAVRWLYALSEPDATGRRTGVVQDITERKLAELALRESELRFRALVDSEMDAIVAVDEQFRVQVFNAAAERLFGLSAAQAVGQPMERFIPVRHRDGHKGSMALFGGLGAPARRMGSTGRVHALRADGAEVPVEASISHVRTQGGVLYTAVLRDITERLQVEEEIRSLNRGLERRVAERTEALSIANRQLSDLVKELEAFSYSVSHDLRAPLRAIGGFSRMVIEDEAVRLSPEGRRKLEVVERNATRMGQLIDDLLNLARINRTELDRQPLDLGALAREVVAELRAHFPRAQVEVGQFPRLEADRTLLRQVLSNLVGNALKYSSRMASPQVTVDWDDAKSALRVRDNGVGFDMLYVNKLFGMFQRLHADPSYEGTGVGLAIVKRVVDRHGGRVWAWSAPGKGASFWVHLPLPVGSAAPS